MLSAPTAVMVGTVMAAPAKETALNVVTTNVVTGAMNVVVAALTRLMLLPMRMGAAELYVWTALPSAPMRPTALLTTAASPRGELWCFAESFAAAIDGRGGDPRGAGKRLLLKDVARRGGHHGGCFEGYPPSPLP